MVTVAVWSERRLAVLGGESADPGVVVGASVAMVCVVGAAVRDGVPAARSGVTGVGTATGLGAGVGVATR